MFTFQIYGDFSGYSDIAIGTSKLFGFNLMQNFNYPYFSRDIAEFWRRWHISLSTWFRDYLYIPLGGSKGGTWMKIRNTFVIFIVSGFWHGANWTFVFWGFLNALYFLPLLLTNKNRRNIDSIKKGSSSQSFKNTINIVKTFSLTVLAWVFFRSETLGQAFTIIKKIFSKSLFLIDKATEYEFIISIFFVVIFLFVEWFNREEEYALKSFLLKKKRIFRWSCYAVFFFLVIIFSGSKQGFIYFQF